MEPHLACVLLRPLAIRWQVGAFAAQATVAVGSGADAGRETVVRLVQEDADVRSQVPVRETRQSCEVDQDQKAPIYHSSLGQGRLAVALKVVADLDWANGCPD